MRIKAVVALIAVVLLVGSLSLFAHEKTTQQIEIQESFTIAQDSEWLFVDDWDEGNNSWTESGVDPYLGDNTDYITANSDEITEGWFSFPDTTLTGTITANISVYAKNADGAGNDHIEVWVDYVSGPGSNLGDCNCDTTYAWFTFSIGDLTVAQANSIRVQFISDMITQPDNVYVERVKIGLSSAGGGDSYEVTIFELLDIADSTDTQVEFSQTIFELLDIFDSTATRAELSQTIYELLDIFDSIETALQTSVIINEVLEFFDSVSAVMNPVETIVVVIYEIIEILDSETITGGMENLNIFYELFLSNSLWSIFGPLVLVVAGYFITQKEKTLGVFFIIVDSLIISQYFSLLSANPNYWWHIIILLLGVVHCTIQLIDR